VQSQIRIGHGSWLGFRYIERLGQRPSDLTQPCKVWPRPLLELTLEPVKDCVHEALLSRFSTERARRRHPHAAELSLRIHEDVPEEWTSSSRTPPPGGRISDPDIEHRRYHRVPCGPGPDLFADAARHPVDRSREGE
jgi:hypothetical protein